MTQDNLREVRDDAQGALPRSRANAIRTALGVSGLVSVIVGVLILVWPGRTAAVVAAIIAVWAAIAGLAAVAAGVFSRRLGVWPRVGQIALGLVFLIAAVVSFSNLAAAAAGLAVLVGVIVGIVWIVDGIVALTMLGDAASKAWSLVYAAVSVIGGVLVLMSPMWGAAVLWMLLGAFLVVTGVVQLFRAFRFGAA